MVQGQKGVIEVQRGDLIRHFGVVGAAWVAIAKDDVVKPVWDHTLGVHQVSDGLQHCLKPRDREMWASSDNTQPSHKSCFSWIRIALWWADGTAGNLYVCQLYFNELQTV